MAKKKSGVKHHATANPTPIRPAAPKAKEKKPIRLYLLGALALIAVIAIVIVCVNGIRENAPLSEEKKAEITQKWTAQYQWGWIDDGNVSGCRYYGEFEGYRIIMQPVASLESQQIKIAGEEFYYDTEFHLFAWRENELTELKTLYKNKDISKEAVAAIAAVHKGSAEDYPTLSAEEKKEAEALWLKLYCTPIWDSGEKQRGSARYYGNYEGYEVFLFVTAVPPDCLGYYRFQIGASVFELDCSANFYGYKDGEFTRLRELYTEGVLSAEDVASVAAKHEKIG